MIIMGSLVFFFWQVSQSMRTSSITYSLTAHALMTSTSERRSAHPVSFPTPTPPPFNACGQCRGHLGRLVLGFSSSFSGTCRLRPTRKCPVEATTKSPYKRRPSNPETFDGAFQGFSQPKRRPANANCADALLCVYVSIR